MGDRRPSLFSRFLASTAPPARRAPAPQTNTSSPTTQTTTKPRAPTTNSTTMSNVELKNSSRRPNAIKTNPSTPTTSPKTKAQMVDQALTNVPTATKPPSPPTIESTKSPSLTENITRPRAPTTQPSIQDQTTIGSIASMNPPNVEPGSPTRRSNASPRKTNTPTTSLNPKTPTVDQPITDASISGYTTSALPKDKPRNVLPSRATNQSRSPPLPPTSSSGAPQQPSTPSSSSHVGTQTPSTPLKASPLHSPSRVASASPKLTPSLSTMGLQPKSLSRESLTTNSRSTKGTESPSPSKEPRRLAQEISNSYGSPIEKGARQLAEIGNEHTSKNEPNQNPHNGQKEVQEVLKAKNTETNAHNEVKKGNGFLTPNPSYSKSDQMSIKEEEALETKEILSTSLLNKKPNNPTASPAPKEGHINSDTPDHMALQKSIKNQLSTFANRMAIADSPNNDRSPSVITLAGENRGAVMQLGSNSSQREGPVHINRSYKLNSEVTSDVDQDSSEGKGAKGAEDQPAEAAYVNNNAQAMNNSIVLSSSISERDPGVHIVIIKETVGPGDGATPIEMRKVELNTTTSANKLVKHEPMVRRRCLRGMLLESSDSDPEKPRRHGCRVGRKEGGL